MSLKHNYNDVFYKNNKRKFYPKTQTFNHIKNTIVIKLLKVCTEVAKVKWTQYF